MTTTTTALILDGFKAAAERAAAVEAEFRQQAARRIGVLERERAFAFRRLNLVSAVARAVVHAEDEPIAVASALAVLREKLGWEIESDARGEVLSRFAPVGQAVYRSLEPDLEAPAAQVQTALGAFEAWYAETHPLPFWALFDQYSPETPRVDF